MDRLRVPWVCLLLGLLQSWAAQAVPDSAKRFTTVDGLPSNLVHALLEDRHGYLWFATDDGVARFDGRRFRTWRREQGLPDNQILAMARDVHDQLWLGTGQGQLVRVSADRQQWDTFDAQRFPAMGHAAVLVILPGLAGEVWFGTRGAGLFRLGPDHRLRQFLPTVRGDGLPDRVVEHLAFTADGSLWVGTPGGLARWHDGHFSRPSPSLLANAPVAALLVDEARQLWVSGAAGPWRGSGSAALEPMDLATESRALGAARQGGAWLARGAMVWRHGGASPHISLASLTAPLAPQFRTVFEDRHGGLWLLGRHLGVWRLPPHWQHFRPVSLPQAPVTSLTGIRLEGGQSHALRCADGTRWRVDGQAVERHRDAPPRSRRWRWDAAHPRPEGPQALHCDASGGLWWGGAQGVRRWKDGRFASPSGSDEETNALHVTADGALWVAGPGVLRRYRISDEGLQHTVRIDERHGVPPLRFHALAEDAHGVLWATSARGLLQVLPREGQVQVYTRADGVPAALLSSHLLAQGMHMLALDKEGRGVRFDPLGLDGGMPDPAPVVERVQVRRDGGLQVLPLRSVLRMDTTDRDLQVTVRRLGPAVETQQYRFRLHGFDRDWIRVGRRGTRGFPKLPAGHYRLEFQARQPDGHWSGSEWMQLVVQRGGWDHPLWVGLRLGLTALLLVGAAWVTLRQVQRSRGRQQSMQRRLLAEQSARAKERYLATLGHEIRTPLTGVLGLSELLLASPLAPAQRQQLERIRQGGQTLLHVLDHALDEARIDAGQMPLQARGIRIADLCRQWQARSVLTLCPQGSGVGLCVHLAPQAQTCGDPERLLQLLDEVTHILVTRTGCAGLVLQVWWQPGRESVLMELATTSARPARRADPAQAARPRAIPSPSRSVLNEALDATQGLVRTLGGTLRLHATDGGRWTVLMRLGLQELGRARVANGLRVLVVEADAEQALILCQLLQAQGHGAVHVAHALAAMAELESAPFDAVLLALELPGLGGLAALEMIRARNARVAVLLTAGPVGDPAALLSATHAAGGNAVLPLPIDPAGLQQALQQAVGEEGSS